MQSCKRQRIPWIRLHPVAGTPRNQARRNHRAGMTHIRDLPVDPIAARASLVAEAQYLAIGTQPIQQSAHGSTDLRSFAITPSDSGSDTLPLTGPPLAVLPWHRSDRFPCSTQEPGSRSCHLPAGCRPDRKQVPSELIPKQPCGPGSDIIQTFATRHRRCTHVQLHDPHLTRSSPAFSQLANHHVS